MRTTAFYPRDRPSWDEYFLEMARVAATRSHDVNTQCGCVIVDQNHQIRGIGYNGFPAGIDDFGLPNCRELEPVLDKVPGDKYDWVIHAEENAILNCENRPRGCVAYVTGKPCFHCVKLLWQSGISEVVCGGQKSTMRDKDTKYESLVNEFLWRTENRLKIRSLDNPTT